MINLEKQMFDWRALSLACSKKVLKKLYIIKKIICFCVTINEKIFKVKVKVEL